MTQIVTDLKPKKEVHNLVKSIKVATGQSMGEFCKVELKSDYKAWAWRLKNNSLYPDEIIYIIWRTKKTVQELFGKDWHQLILDNSSGPVVDDVKSIIRNLTKDENRELERLMGVEPYKNTDKKTPKVKKEPQKGEITQKTEPPKEDPLKDIFEDTY